MIRLVCILLCMTLFGCESTSSNYNAKTTQSLFDDSLFLLDHLPPVESQEEVFALSDGAKAFVDTTLADANNPDHSVELLSGAIFDRAQLGLIYDNSATTTANETFVKGAANCLSMTIMTYSMANYASLDTRFMSVDIPEYWTRRDGFSLLNGHVNIEIRTKRYVVGSHITPRATVIDFDPQEIRRFFSRRPVNKNQIMALFYNNRAADALLKQNYNHAYQYLRAAAEKDYNLDDVWVNLGVLYRFTEHYELAERAYRQAIQLQPTNYTAYENLAILLKMTGRERQSQRLSERVARARKNNPFYHFILGEEARGNGHFDKAVAHYRRAIRIDNTKHEIYFGLGAAMFELGDIARAKNYINKAARLAPSEDTQTRYRSKLSVLQSGLKPHQAL